MAEGAASAIYHLFARMLEYPTPALLREARKLLELLASGCGTPASAGGEDWSPSGRAEAAALVEGFCGYVEGTPLAQVEELYTRTFDMQPVCYPYVGHQLFGESYKRSMFMAELNAGYRERGFSAGNELPDHIAVVLRFLASGMDGDFGQGLLSEGLIPALGKMEQAFGESSANPYADVIGALSHLLGAPARSHEKGVGDA